MQTVLIVEDDPDLAFGLEIRLAHWGYRVQLAGDGTSGLEKARRTRPDLVLLDLGLPGIDGFEVLERMRLDAATREIPVIVLTGRDPHAARDKAIALGAQDFLTKPAENEELLASIRRLMPAAV